MLKPNKIKLLLALCIAVAGIWLTVEIVLKTHQSKGPVEMLKQLPKNIDISLQKIHYTDTKDGEKRWDLVADKVEYDRNVDYTYLKNVRMEIFPKGKDSGKVTLVAERATYHNKTGDVEVAGRVKADNDAGMRLETDHLSFDSSRSMIYTRDRVKFTDHGLIVEGTGMEFMLKAKSVRVLNDVTAHVGVRTE